MKTFTALQKLADSEEFQLVSYILGALSITKGASKKEKELQRKYKLLKKIFIFHSNHCSKTAPLFPSSIIGAPDGWCQNLSRSVRLLCVLGQKPSEQTA